MDELRTLTMLQQHFAATPFPSRILNPASPLLAYTFPPRKLRSLVPRSSANSRRLPAESPKEENTREGDGTMRRSVFRDAADQRPRNPPAFEAIFTVPRDFPSRSCGSSSANSPQRSSRFFGHAPRSTWRGGAADFADRRNDRENQGTQTRKRGKQEGFKNPGRSPVPLPRSVKRVPRHDPGCTLCSSHCSHCG